MAKQTAAKCIDDLGAARVLRETTGKQRDRVYVYEAYLATLTGDDARRSMTRTASG